MTQGSQSTESQKTEADKFADSVAEDILRLKPQGIYVRDERDKPMKEMSAPHDPRRIGEDSGGYTSLPREVARDRFGEIEKGNGIAASSVRNIQEQKLSDSQGTLGDAIEDGLRAARAYYAADRNNRISKEKADAVLATLKKIEAFKNETSQTEKDKKAVELGKDPIYQAQVARTGAAVTTNQGNKIPVHEHATPTLRGLAAKRLHADLVPDKPVPGAQVTAPVLPSLS